MSGRRRVYVSQHVITSGIVYHFQGEAVAVYARVTARYYYMSVLCATHFTGRSGESVRSGHRRYYYMSGIVCYSLYREKR
ncbi:hypothetical protein J6590_078179 [Homalodisca vitripennis]|nr:hypothetical protein J6590_078179 [Homalodisca vitripennis]